MGLYSGGFIIGRIFACEIVVVVVVVVSCFFFRGGGGAYFLEVFLVGLESEFTLFGL